MSLHSFLKPNSDARCHMMAYHLLQWEFTAMLAPEEIVVDVFDMLCIRGGAPL